MAGQALPFKTRILDRIRGLLKPALIEGIVRRLTVGHSPEDFLGRIPPNHYQYPTPSPRLVSQWGVRFTLDISDLIDWAIFFGFSDPARTCLLSLLAPGDTVVDIGCNVGEVALRAASLVGPAGRVIAFEPDPTNHARCASNLALNGFTNICLENTALGDSEGSSWTHLESPDNRGALWLSGDKAQGSAQVPTTTLDAYCPRNGLQKISLIKIDVEGSEMRVLRGLEKSLARFRPILFVEIDDALLRRGGTRAADVVSWIESRGYRIESADEARRPIARGAGLDARHFDVVCLPAEGTAA